MWAAALWQGVAYNVKSINRHLRAAGGVAAHLPRRAPPLLSRVALDGGDDRPAHRFGGAGGVFRSMRRVS